MKALLLRLSLLVFSFLPLAGAAAQTKPFVHQLFSSNMVLQRDASDPIWGWTTAGSQVTVTINGQTRSTTAASDGRWEVAIGPFAAGGPYTLQVSGPQTATFSNVLFGDVFLCSGQSNMEFVVNSGYNAASEVADSANYPNIRCFTVPKVSSFTPEENLSTGAWRAAGPSTTGSFSAVGYYMARELYKKMGIPIGILVSAWGGTQIQSWVSYQTSSSIADFTQTIFDQKAGVPTADTISGHYNGLIHPLATFRIRAAVWYQGEFNSGRGQQYSRLLSPLLSEWRTLFAQPDLPFIIVQLPNNDATQASPVETGGYAEIREAQANAVRADAGRSRLVTTIDIGEGILHPLDKQDVGLRASWAAQNLIYGQSTVVGQGPICTGTTVSGSTIVCTFSDVGAGLMVGTKNPKTPLSAVQQTAGTSVKGFAIAGPNHVFYAANASISGTNAVTVSSPSVSTPQFVRYGWANNPVCNLYNKLTDGSGNVINGIPAGSFRNDPVYKLNVNAATGGKESYTIPTQSTVTASVPAGEIFHHWGGDLSTISSNAKSTIATLSQTYVSLRAYFQITSAPTMTVSTEVGQNVIQWSSLSAAHFNVKRSTTSSGPFTIIAGNLLGVTRYVDTDITDGTTYYYKVSGLNEVGEGPETAAVPATALAYVHGLKATPGNAIVGLTWDDFGANSLSYTIRRSTTEDGPYQSIASELTGTQFTDRTVVAGQTYHYVVSSTTADGDTPLSPEASATPNFLPPPLASQDLGAVALTGSASMDASGTLTLTGSGADIGGTADAFRLAYLPITGNCTLIARVASLQNTNASARGGIMCRATLDPNSPSACAFFLGSQTGTGSLFRATTGANTTGSTASGANRWLRLVRSGNTFTCSSSADGSIWTQIGTPQTISMPATIYAGTAVTSHDNTKVNTAVFDSLSGFNLNSPQPPQNLTTSVRGNDASVVLRWDAAPGAIGYTIKRATSSGGPYTVIASNIQDLHHAPVGLASGRRYYFVVSATTGAGVSPDSAEVSVNIASKPSGIPAPTAFSAEAGNTTVALSWRGSSLATSYKVKRSTANGGPYTILATLPTDSYRDTAVVNGTRYYYVVSTVTSEGESTNSAQVSVSPNYPAVAGTITASVNNRYVSAIGSAALIANKDVAGTTELFDLLDLGGGLTAIRSLANGNYVTVKSPGDNQLYAVQGSVAANEKFIFTYTTEEDFSFTANVNSMIVTAEASGSAPLIANRTRVGGQEAFTFTPNVVPPPPSNVMASPGDGTVELQWDAISGATAYLVRRATVSGGPYTLAGTTTAATFRDPVSNGVTYYYVISAMKGALSGAASGEISAVPQVLPPDAPSDLSATAASESQILLSWTAPSPLAATYIVQRSPSGADTWSTLSSSLSGTAVSYLDESAAASTGYDYRVQSVGSGGGSAFALASGTTPTGIGDGIPGSWRYRYFGNGLTLTPDSALNSDPDSDGLSNQAEYQAGTDPRNSQSALKILSLTPNGSDMVITFSSVSGKSYSTEKSTSLGNSTVWTLLQDNIPGTGEPVQVTDPSALSKPTEFYRVRLK